MLRPLLVLPVLLFAVPAIANADAPQKSPSMMTSTEIRAHNKTLASTDGTYIRCRKFTETGSLVKQARVCKTNTDWGGTFRTGNQNARDTVDAMTRAPISNPN